MPPNEQEIISTFNKFPYDPNRTNNIFRSWYNHLDPEQTTWNFDAINSQFAVVVSVPYRAYSPPRLDKLEHDKKTRTYGIAQLSQLVRKVKIKAGMSSSDVLDADYVFSSIGELFTGWWNPFECAACGDPLDSRKNKRTHNKSVADTLGKVNLVHVTDQQVLSNEGWKGLGHLHCPKGNVDASLSLGQ